MGHILPNVFFNTDEHFRLTGHVPENTVLEWVKFRTWRTKSELLELM